MILLLVGLQCQTRHDGYQVQKQDNVAGKEVGDFLTEMDFEVVPERLVDEPGAHARHHHEPKNADTSAGAKGIGDHDNRGAKQQKSLTGVADYCKRKATG